MSFGVCLGAWGMCVTGPTVCVCVSWVWVYFGFEVYHKLKCVSGTDLCESELF